MGGIKHGLRYTKEYTAWDHMKRRCNNPNDKAYKDYGGRGISVCERWQTSFKNFYEDMGQSPGYGFSLDRINNDGNYEPSNCRWATCKTQSKNTRVSINSIYGKSTEKGIARHTVYARVKKLGWSLDKALSTPSRNAPFITITTLSK